MKIYSFLIFILLIFIIKCDIQLVSCTKADSGVFNLCFYDNGELIKTTSGEVHGNGYGVVLKIDSNEYEIISTSQTIDNIKIVTLLVNISDHVGIRHIISNSGDVEKTISIAVHADIQIYEEDCVPIYRIDPMRGFKFSDDQYSLYLLFLKNYENHPAIDSIWYGPWDERFFNLWINASSSSFTDDDSSITYSWQNYRLLPNEKINFTAAFTLNPDFNFSIIPDYIPTEKFTPSNTFSHSNVFTNSNLFSGSYKFPESRAFTKSIIFSKSKYFSFSDYFTKSSIFSQSNYEIINSNIFSYSQLFSNSEDFTKSILYSSTLTMNSSLHSNAYTTNQIILSRGVKYSIVRSLTYTRVRSVSFSMSYSYSNNFNYYPYIIHYFSQSYTISYIYIYPKKKTITSEKLIGIVSITASAFFFILYVIINLARSSQINESSEDYKYLKYFLKKEKKISGDEDDDEIDITKQFWF